MLHVATKKPLSLSSIGALKATKSANSKQQDKKETYKTKYQETEPCVSDAIHRPSHLRRANFGPSEWPV